MNVRGVRVRRHVVESLAMLEGEAPLTIKEVASREGVTPAAIRKRRRRLEVKLKSLLPRHESRGRKPTPISC